MNTEIKKLWVNALKSGDYKQGFKQSFYDGELFCAIGVLMDIFFKTQYTTWVHGAGKAQSEIDKLMFDFENWSGLELCDLEIMHINDVERKSFLEIADFIESNR